MKIYKEDRIYENDLAPIKNLIRNSFNNKDWNVCYEACDKYVKSCDKNKDLILPYYKHWIQR